MPLRDAMRWNLVQRSVSELVTPPRKAHYEFRVLSSEEAHTFLQAVRGDRLEALYVLAITTGTREGELFGLRWTDINMTTHSLHLVKQLKTKSSRRQVLLPRIAAEALTAHRARQARRACPRWYGVGGPRPGLHQLPGPAAAPEELPCCATSIRCWSGPACRDAVPRPAPQRGDTAARTGDPSQGRERDVGPQPDRHHVGPLLSRNRYDAAASGDGARRPVP